MDSFGPGVSGFWDVEDQLARYLREESDAHLAAAREEKLAIDSRKEHERRVERVREAFLEGIGGLPDPPDEVSAERTGVVERDGYDVERLVLESLPDFHVTANCYVPDGEGPHPAVLLLCGHVDSAKADPDNQRACIELALNGLVVCVVDPLCQGEREQYRDPETGEALVSGGGGVFAHCYAGHQCYYAGANLARWLVHDARCALTYLHDRPDVDGDRVGVAGTSGGGIQTQYLALVDDRVDAAAPCCSVTDRSVWLQTGKRVDAEQNVAGAVARSIDFDDFLAAMAPRPLCVGAAASDEYFPVEGVHAAVERVRRVYGLYDDGGAPRDGTGHGAADAVTLVVADEPHCSVYELGAGVLGWLCETLGAGDYESHDDLAVLPESDLHCTPDGSVRAAYLDERTIDDLIRAYVRDRYGDSPTADDESLVVDGESSAADPEWLRRTVVDRLGVERFDGNRVDRPHRTDRDRHVRTVAESEHDGLRVEHVFFPVERDPYVVVTGVLVSDPDASVADSAGGASASESDAPPAVVLYEEGTEALPDRSGDLAALAAEHGTVLAFDPRGVGAVRNRAIPVPNWVEDYHGVYGTEFKLAYDALHLGTSLFGMRVRDVLAAVDVLRERTGDERTGSDRAGSEGGDSSEVALVGEGVGAYHALYAAAIDGAVAEVTLRDLGPSFREMATSREYPYDPRLAVFDVVGDCDVPHCLAALAERGVRVERANRGA